METNQNCVLLHLRYLESTSKVLDKLPPCVNGMFYFLEAILVQFHLINTWTATGLELQSPVLCMTALQTPPLVL